METRDYSLLDFIVVTMNGKLFISSAEDMNPVEIDEDKFIKGYYYDLSEEVSLRVDQNKLIVSANNHPDKTNVAYHTYNVSEISQSDINTITVNENINIRKIQITTINFNGTTFILGTTDLCYT